MNTSAQIIDLAQHYLQTLGFNGFSFQTIADDLKIKKASIHYHFKSKEELGLKLIEQYQAAFISWSELKNDLPPEERLVHFFKLISVINKDEDKICPMGVLCADYLRLPTSMKKKLGQFHETQRNWVIKILQDGQKNKVFHLTQRANVLAEIIMGQTQGAIQLMRLTKNNKMMIEVSHFWLTHLKNRTLR